MEISCIQVALGAAIPPLLVVEVGKIIFSLLFNRVSLNFGLSFDQGGRCEVDYLTLRSHIVFEPEIAPFPRHGFLSGHLRLAGREGHQILVPLPCGYRLVAKAKLPMAGHRLVQESWGCHVNERLDLGCTLDNLLACLFQERHSGELFPQVTVPKIVCLELCFEGLDFVRSVFISDQVLDHEELVVVEFVHRHFLHVLDDDRAILPCLV